MNRLFHIWYGGVGMLEDVGGEEDGPMDGAPDTFGHWKVLPVISMSRMSVSIGVLPTRRTKKSCSITAGETVRKDGSRRRSRPNLVGWLG